ncbi:plant VAP-like protein 12 [Perilla frutescens var. hirtella]|uniref:Plant VAP-like protein 12 n=1 Tax=Perilla frutescens var. hirtella TaxID=608512 RepID=A0AAD4ILZ1_PERFH|nr:plant VAP-like protein 12 [Perilla frutescens var. hirtella]
MCRYIPSYRTTVYAEVKIYTVVLRHIPCNFEKMSSGELLIVDPLELKFSFEVNKQISCSIQASNQTDNHVAFKVKTTNPKKYCVRPNTGVILPRSSSEILVTMQAQKEAPSDMQCKDKFLLQSIVVSPNINPKDITPETFAKDQGHVEECKLKVVYVAAPQTSSPAVERSEEGSQGSTMIDNGIEAQPLISKLTEEKATAIQRSNKLRQELEMLKRDNSKGGVSIIFVIVIGLLGLVLGYFMKVT